MLQMANLRSTQKHCCHHQVASLLKASPVPPGKKYVLANEGRVAALVAKAFVKFAKKVVKALSKSLPKPTADKADLSRLIKAERTVEDIIKAVLDEIDLDGFSTSLAEELVPELVKAFEAGGLSGLDLVGVRNDRAMVELVPQDAVDYAKQRAAELVGKTYDKETKTFVDNPNPAYSITDTTRDGIRDLTSQALEQGWSAGELEANVTEAYAFSDARSETIARTELAKAHVQGNVKAWSNTGRVKGKSWLLADTHPEDDECDDAADEGIIALDELFEATGEDGPPAHPNCLCALVPELIGEDDSEKAALTSLNPLRAMRLAN